MSLFSLAAGNRHYSWCCMDCFLHSFQMFSRPWSWVVSSHACTVPYLPRIPSVLYMFHPLLSIVLTCDLYLPSFHLLRFITKSESLVGCTQFLPPALRPGISFKAVSWDIPQNNVICFRNHCSSLPEVCYFEKNFYVVCFVLLLVSCGNVNQYFLCLLTRSRLQWNFNACCRLTRMLFFLLRLIAFCSSCVSQCGQLFLREIFLGPHLDQVLLYIINSDFLSYFSEFIIVRSRRALSLLSQCGNQTPSLFFV